MEPADTLERLRALQRSLEDRTSALDGSAAAVLDIGPSVLEFAASEELAFLPLLELLDPAVRTELAREHDSLTEDLALLRWLAATTPDSTDVSVLAQALTGRIRNHIARDGRLLTQASRLSAPGDPTTGTK
jgi:hypothetical protein